jgi:hypothetical protein
LITNVAGRRTSVAGAVGFDVVEDFALPAGTSGGRLDVTAVVVGVVVVVVVVVDDGAATLVALAPALVPLLVVALMAALELCVDPPHAASRTDALSVAIAALARVIAPA